MRLHRKFDLVRQTALKMTRGPRDPDKDNPQLLGLVQTTAVEMVDRSIFQPRKTRPIDRSASRSGIPAIANRVHYVKQDD